MEELFCYHGGNDNDTAWLAMVMFSFDEEAEEELADVNLLFLAKHGNIPPDWTERQDLPRVQRLTRLLIDMLTPRKVEAQPRFNDRPHEGE